MVCRAGVTVVQGHLIGQPTPEAGLAALIRRLELDVAPNPLLADPAPDPQP